MPQSVSTDGGVKMSSFVYRSASMFGLPNYPESVNEEVTARVSLQRSSVSEAASKQLDAQGWTQGWMLLRDWDLTDIEVNLPVAAAVAVVMWAGDWTRGVG